VKIYLYHIINCRIFIQKYLCQQLICWHITGWSAIMFYT